MNYPDDFYTPTFPAGKSVAVSRAMGIGVMSVFFLIVCLCGILMWTIRSARVEPYILATGGINDQWRVIYAGKQHINASPNRLFQQSLVWHFVQNWFTISADSNQNNMIWDTECTIDDCATWVNKDKKCALFCSSDNVLFRHFTEDVLPKYKFIESVGSTWMPESQSVRIEPTSKITNDGGNWRIQMTVLTDGGNRAMDIIAYAHVARNTKYFPATMGYYVQTFNAYRISQ